MGMEGEARRRSKAEAARRGTGTRETVRERGDKDTDADEMMDASGGGGGQRTTLRQVLGVWGGL